MESENEILSILGIKKEQKPIAGGNEKNVYEDTTDETRVIKILDPEIRKSVSDREMKGEYYLTKILRFLFPLNIPDVYMATGGSVKGSKNEKISFDSAHKRVNKRILKQKTEKVYDGKEITYPEFHQLEKDPRILQFIHELEEIGIDFDTEIRNFGFDAQENVKYADSFSPFVPWKIEKGYKPNFNAEKLRMAIEERLKDSPEEKEQALRYLERLNILLEEEYKSYGY